MDTDEDTAVTIDVLASDSDVDGDALTVSSVTQPANGSAVNNGTDVTYTPDADYCGSDGFGYAASDGSPAATRQRHRVDGPTNGDLAGAGANLTYTHHASYTTTERFVQLALRPVGESSGNEWRQWPGLPSTVTSVWPFFPSFHYSVPNCASSNVFIVHHGRVSDHSGA